jgi:hypothetical protein
MAQAIHSRGAIRSATVPIGAGDPTLHCLTAILTFLLCDPRPTPLPDWTYRTWCRVLQYPELRARAQTPTKELGCRRDEALSHPAVRLLVEWAGSRRRDNPAAAAAAALATVRLAQVGSRYGLVDVPELSRRVAAMADAARPVRFSSSYRAQLMLAYPDRLAALEQEPAAAENPQLSAAVGELLRLAGADSASLLTPVEAAVVQAGDWWTRHASPVPTSVDGPRLPGVLPARQLRPAARLSAQMFDPTLLGLVAGPHPGRARPCQVAWRRGLTFWVAVRLSALDTAHQPPSETIRWWRTQLAALALGPAGPERFARPCDVHSPRTSSPVDNYRADVGLTMCSQGCLVSAAPGTDHVRRTVGSAVTTGDSV